MRLMSGTLADAVFTDPPYNVRVAGHVQGRAKIKHKEFAFASGEMSECEFRSFLSTCLSSAAHASRDGAVHYICMDWRHIDALIEQGRKIYSAFLNLVVWNKTNAGQGSFYRSQHELIGVFRAGSGRHQNNVELGKHGRSRTNVWTYAGVSELWRRARRSDGYAPDSEARRPGGRRAARLHDQRKLGARSVSRVRDDPHRGGKNRAAVLRPRIRACLCRRRHSALAGLHALRRHS